MQNLCSVAFKKTIGHNCSQSIKENIDSWYSLLLLFIFKKWEIFLTPVAAVESEGRQEKILQEVRPFYLSLNLMYAQSLKKNIFLMG